jgi:hypothetical protein
MRLNCVFDESFGNIYVWKGIREKAGESSGTEVYITKDKDYSTALHQFLQSQASSAYKSPKKP